MALPAGLQPDFKDRCHVGADVEIQRVGAAGGRSGPQAAVCSGSEPSPGCLGSLLPETDPSTVGGAGGGELPA